MNERSGYVGEKSVAAQTERIGCRKKYVRIGNFR